MNPILTLGDRLSPPTRLNHWGWVGLNLTLWGGLSLSHWGSSLPWQPCLFQRLFGFPSPGCGFTRSLLALSRDDWQLALSYHLFAPLLWLLCLIAGYRAAIELSLGRSLQLALPPTLTRLHQTLWRWRSLLPLVTLFLLYYLLRLYVRYTLPPLPTPPLTGWDWFAIGAKAL